MMDSSLLVSFTEDHQINLSLDHDITKLMRPGYSS
jgi:hypothetical protein